MKLNTRMQTQTTNIIIRVSDKTFPLYAGLHENSNFTIRLYYKMNARQSDVGTNKES